MINTIFIHDVVGKVSVKNGHKLIVKSGESKIKNEDLHVNGVTNIEVIIPRGGYKKLSITSVVGNVDLKLGDSLFDEVFINNVVGNIGGKINTKDKSIKNLIGGCNLNINPQQSSIKISKIINTAKKVARKIERQKDVNLEW